MNNKFISLLIFIFFNSIFPVLGGMNKPEETLSLLFIGDIMGHKTQHVAAYDAGSKTYQYDDVFQHIKPVISAADFAIANLEVTLAGEPYTGYPCFSAPDALASACKNSGIHVMVTANNHSYDRGKQGIIRTIQTLDRLQIMHTGTFLSKEHRKKTNLLILEKNNIKVGLLNYTYGANGLCASSLVGMINVINREQILKDITASNSQALDQLVVFLHWGEEYKTQPNVEQETLANFLIENGVDIVIGAHPHVLQKMVLNTTEKNKPYFIAYSLGNFVSNQGVISTSASGGAMVSIQLTKKGKKTFIDKAGYVLIYVNKETFNGKPKFSILPCAKYINQPSFFKEKKSFLQMNHFVSDARILLQKENVNVHEMTLY
ncbi:CapA family protein [Cardinium endosymbiont of Culicoides punctatus]|uniref:CapA family protein n=1 Tax=Cardinium endosymbiont of Culicoides punctatus TaxID=2304601 RepID=UPI001058A1F8|nr:CapA family protein [Cardinium endosymbiont of Culicoides punctatus]TDG95570.1 Capsule biosynthesis protein CapA [Cardinium endosymbiont of Culicoides punctatus]